MLSYTDLKRWTNMTTRLRQMAEELENDFSMLLHTRSIEGDPPCQYQDTDAPYTRSEIRDMFWEISTLLNTDKE